MKKFRPRIIISVVILVSLLTAALCSCGNSYCEKTYLAMDTVMEIRIYDGDETLLNGCGDIITSLEKKLSTTDKNSLVYRLNAGETVVDAEVSGLINNCISFSTTTDGAFDVTVFPIVKAYGFMDKNFRLPDNAELSAMLDKVGYDKLNVTGETIVLPDGVEIDLGAIAKGYCSDRIKSFLKENGVTSGVINLGGNVMTIGKKNDKDWRVAIADPYGNGYIGILNVTDAAVVTSGLYERYFEKDGVKYGHIIDPHTGKPVNNGFLSVTVVGDDGTECDALSTALFVMGLDKAKQYVVDNGIDAIFLTDDGVIHITEKIESKFEQSGEYKTHAKAVIHG